MPDGEDARDRGRGQSAADVVRTARKYRTVWMACTGCGCLPSCGILLLVFLGFTAVFAAIYYLCNEFLWGAAGFLEEKAAAIGLSEGICRMFRSP